MTAPLSGGQFEEPQVKGMFGGSRATKGLDGAGNMSLISGSTRGQDQATWLWRQYPYVIGGLTSYDPQQTMPGSNLNAVSPDVSDLARDAGMDDVPTGYSQGGTAAY
jgi:hypothetical protein